MSEIKLKWLLPLILIGFSLGLLLSLNMQAAEKPAETPLPVPSQVPGEAPVLPPSPIPTAEPPPAAQQDLFPAAGTSFQLVEPNKGWLLTGGKLYWTGDNGGTWANITPQSSARCNLSGIEFANSRDGYLFCNEADKEELVYTFYQTHDTGLNWTERALNLSVLVPQPHPNPVETIQMQWLDPENGFVLFRLQAGTNFSLGYLFSTRDGGLNWKHLNAPSGEPFVFVSPLLGYQLDNPSHSAISATSDGGESWQVLNLAAEALAEGQSVQLSLPQFNPDGQGWISARVYSGIEQVASNFYRSPEAGGAWSQAQVSEQKTLPMAGLGEEHFAVASDGGIVRWQDGLGELPVQKDPNLSTAAFTPQEYTLTDLSLGDPTNAWASFQAGNCDFVETAEGVQKVCQSQKILLASQDAGQGWQMLKLPAVSADLQVKTIYSAPEPQAKSLDELKTESLRGAPAKITYIGNNRAILQEQGFDLCYFQSVERMQTWMRSSPYWAVNLYIGGDMAGCAGRHPERDDIGKLYAQGWKFIPTWVGPQAPCTGYRVKMDYDPDTAYQQGVQNANAAITRMAELGLLMPDGTGSVVYYDLESYVPNTACTAAVQAFMRGWTTRLNQKNVTSGLYATGYNLNNSGAATIKPAPQVIWPAAWYHAAVEDRYYSPTATVWNVRYLDNALWANHQRIRQYEGGHTETWGGVSMNIDCNVIDSVVAVLDARSSPMPPNCSTSKCQYLPIIGK